MNTALPENSNNQPQILPSPSQPPLPAPGTTKKWITPARFMTGLISLLLRGASEVTRIAGEIHGVIHQSPPIVSRNLDPDLQAAPRLYQMIHSGFVHTANQIQKANDLLPSTDSINQDLRRLHSIMNGVIGDKLHDWSHPGAIAMQCYDQHHQAVSLKAIQAQHPKGVALFLHGLCLSEYDWRGAQAEQFAANLNTQGFGIARLRYNTGLSLTENGQLLSHLLEQEWNLDARQSLLMIGHSMGGLVIRSALHHGRDIFHHGWVDQVTHAAYVASPHEGANLEKLGNFANNLLGYSPYTKPLMALGNIRSRGIRSLRESSNKHEQALASDSLELFHDKIHHLLIGARLPDPRAQAVLGDGMVTDHSAMGSSHFPEEHHQVTRLIIDEAGHMKVINDPRLYQTMAIWLENTSDR